MEVCARLVDHLPSRLDGHRSRVVAPVTPLTHAWGKPPIVMRCGVPKPPSYTPTSPLTTKVNGVLWFQQIGAGQVVWTAIRQSTNIELTVPTSYDAQGAFLIDLGNAIEAAIP